MFTFTRTEHTVEKEENMDKHILRNAAQRHPAAILQPYDALMGLEGFDAIYALSENLSGATIYVPSARKIFATCLEMEAAREFNGYNYDALAKKYGFSSRHLRRVLSGA